MLIISFILILSWVATSENQIRKVDRQSTSQRILNEGQPGYTPYEIYIKLLNLGMPPNRTKFVDLHDNFLLMSSRHAKSILNRILTGKGLKMV